MNTRTYRHPYDPMLLTMHDCIVTQIDLETIENDIRMTWQFPDGIWVTPEIPCHKIKETCRTAEAELVFTVKRREYEWDASAAICMKSRWHGKDKRMNTETWEYMNLPEFISKIRKNGWSLEIIHTYTEGYMFLVTGEVNSPKERRFLQFRLEFWADLAHCNWDEIRPDRVW